MLDGGLQVYTLSVTNKNHYLRTRAYAQFFLFLSIFLNFYSEMGKKSHFLGLTSEGKRVELRSRVCARQEIERKEE